MKRSKSKHPPPPSWGMDIGKYFKSSQAPGQATQATQAVEVAPDARPDLPKPGPKVRSSKPTRHLALPDNFMLSQDVDENMQEVVWAASPRGKVVLGVASREASKAPQHPAADCVDAPLKAVENTSHDAASQQPAPAPDAPFVAPAQQEHMKQSLIAAKAITVLGVKRPSSSQQAGSDTKRHNFDASAGSIIRRAPSGLGVTAGVTGGSTLAGSAGTAPDSTGVEGLTRSETPRCTLRLSRQSSAGCDAAPGQPQVCDDAVLAEVLQWSEREAAKTPATLNRSRGSTARSGVLVGLGSSAVKVLSHGKKRRTFFDLLDQVEAIARQSESPGSESGRIPRLPQEQPQMLAPARRRSFSTTPPLPPTSFDIGVNQAPATTVPTGSCHTAAGISSPPGRPDTAGQLTQQAAAAPPVTAYECSLQDYEDFLDSLDMDALEAAERASGPQPLVGAATTTSLLQQVPQGSQPLATQAAEVVDVTASAPPGCTSAAAAPIEHPGVAQAVEATMQVLVPPMRAVASQPSSCADTAARHQPRSAPRIAASEASVLAINVPGRREPLQPIDNIVLHPPVQQSTKTAEAVATGTAVASMPPPAPVQLVGDRRGVHYQVLEVMEHVDEKQLTLIRSFPSGEQDGPVVVHLRDVWGDLHVLPGDPVNLLAEVHTGLDGRLHAVCSAQQGMIVLHPDILLSGTTITSSMDCPRKAWLAEMLGGGSNATALLGTLMHEVVQETLQAAMRAPVAAQDIEQTVCNVITAAGMKLYEVGLSAEDAHKDLMAKSAVVRAWATHYAGRPPQQGMELRMGPGHKGPVIQAGIADIADIEEQIWAPRYGLKGQLDASLRIRVASADDPRGRHSRHPGGAQSGPGFSSAPMLHAQAHPGRHSAPASSHPWAVSSVPASAEASTQEIVVPFEYKSGKHHFSHRAQVALYLLLMEDRYQEACDVGLLWNSNDGPAAMQAVQRVPAELAALMMHRNRLAAHLAPQVRSPPPMLQSDFQCGRCHAKAACSIYHKAVEGGDAASSGFASDQWQALTSHLSDSHCQFFSHWSLLVELEEGDARKRRALLWAAPGAERQAAGTCLAGLTLQAYEGAVSTESGPQHCYVFAKQRPDRTAPPAQGPDAVTAAGGASAAESMAEEGGGAQEFDAGELLVLSIEGQHANVARVVVLEVSQACVRVLSKKRIRPAHQVLSQQPETQPPQQPGSGTHGHPCVAPGVAGPSRTVWRLDRDEPASGSVIMRSNLVELMSNTNTVCNRLRQLVVDLAPPRRQRLAATRQAAVPQSQQPSEVCLSQAVATGRLNAEQGQAVRSILEMQDYALVLGMPGTGKTSTIVEAIRALLAVGRSVLLTAYTNSAVDNIGLKLAAAGIDFVRVPGASLSSIHPGVRDHVPGGARFPAGTTAQGFAELVSRVRVVAVTCLGLRHPLLARRTFDVCILDEASQVSLPACMGPLTRARTWVLVGDHYQLPPLVTNPEAAARGYGESLFRRLCEAHPQAMVTLSSQYRMAAPIMALSNTLIYSGALSCGTESVATQRLQLPLWEHWTATPDGRCTWLTQALDPSRHVVFLNTDTCPGCEDRTHKDGVYNAGEAHVLQRLVAALLACGVSPKDLGVVSTYRAQVSLMQRLLAKTGPLTRSAPASHQELGAGGPSSSVRGEEAAADAQPVSHAGAQVEALTIDKYQGRDKEVILLSWVRSNEEAMPGRLLGDWQRVNVALTRAKCKLVMVGSLRTLSAVPLLAAMSELLRGQGSVVALPPGAGAQAS